MIVIIIDALLFWTILSGIGGLAGVFALVITIAKNRQRKRVELERSCDELCAAISNSKIHTLLNNINAICAKGIDDAKSIIEIQNALKQIYQEASTKWDAVKSRLNTRKQKELFGKLEAIFHNYQSCAKDAETIVIALGLGNVDEVKYFLSNINSQEIRDIVNTTSGLYENDFQGFIKQVISLRFMDLDIPDLAGQIRGLMNESYQDENVLETQLLARIGNARAQNALGDYYYGQKQFNKAFDWYKKSAEQGYADAQDHVGWAYEEGEGVEKNKKKAFEWYKKAAEQNFAKAQRHLGCYYINGEGEEKDAKEAVKWFKKAAEQGDTMAQVNLGVCYINGEGEERDAKEAVKWFKKAAEQGDAMAQFNLGACYINGEGVEKDAKEAFKWFEKAAEQGDAMAQFNLGACYINGEGVEKDAKEAFKWFEKAANQGDSNAQYWVGVCYYNGEGVEKDAKATFEWYKKSAERGNYLAQFGLGYMYDTGDGCDQDYDKAFYWYNKASESIVDIDIYRRAIFNLGVMYEKGTIGMGSTGAAIGYYEIAAQYGDDSAQCKLGYCYENGMGVKEIDIEKAKHWYGEAAKQGNEEAIASLARLNAN